MARRKQTDGEPRVRLVKDRAGATTWGGNGFGTHTDSARWVVVVDGVAAAYLAADGSREYMGPAPAWKLTAMTGDGAYRVVRRWYAPHTGGGASREAKAWVRAHPDAVVRLVKAVQGIRAGR